MFKRILTLPKNRNFFLFGARDSGKTTLLESRFDKKRCLWIDLLDLEEEDHYSRHPQDLLREVLSLPKSIKHIIVDEVQKLPKLLDVVHSCIEKTNKHFILTGSSARKLKHGGANLLAGRAFVYHLHPLSYLEVGQAFNLEETLQFGLLPESVSYKKPKDKREYLRAYALTYLKEEIWGEHLIKLLDPFRRFLEVAAQSNGKIINFNNIGRDVDVDDKTVKEYFMILEDTLLGFLLPPFRHSFRKRLRENPKFYFFDVGVVRALSRTLSVPLKKRTTAYGDAFEHFVILECIKLASYYQPDYRFSYLRTKDDAEVDLIVDRPGKPYLFIEIKSKDSVDQYDLKSLKALASDFKDCEAICFSQDKRAKLVGDIKVYPWAQGIKKYFKQIEVD